MSYEEMVIRALYDLRVKVGDRLTVIIFFDDISSQPEMRGKLPGCAEASAGRQNAYVPAKL